MAGLDRRYLHEPRCVPCVLQYAGHFVREAEGPVLRRKQKTLPHLLTAFRAIHGRSHHRRYTVALIRFNLLDEIGRTGGSDA